MIASRLYHATKKDPYWNNVVFLLGVNAEGNKNSQFIDSSANNFTMTANGYSHQGIVNPYKNSNVGSWTHPNGAAGNITFPASANFLFLGNYTIEAWLMLTATGNWCIYDNTGSGGNAQISQISGAIWHGDTVSSWGTPNLSLNTWYHLAFSRAGNTLKFFINGILFGTKTIAGSIGSSTNIGAIGIRRDGTYNTSGYIADLRVVNGTAVYTEDFTPPIEPLLTIPNTVLHCKFNNFNVFDKKKKSNGYFYGTATASPINSKFGYSIETPVSNDRLFFTPWNGECNYGLGDFTWELWCYYTTYKSNMYLIDHNNNGGTLQFYTNQIRYYNGGQFHTGVSIPANQWNHIAACRASGIIKIYLNGIQAGGSYSDVKDYNAVTRLNIGNYGGGGTYNWNGQIEEVRLTRGIARYTHDFVPPTRQFPTR